MRSTEARPFINPTVEEHRFLPEGPRRGQYAGSPALTFVNIQTGVDATTGQIAVRPDSTGATQWHSLPGRPGFALPVASRPKRTVESRLLIGLDKSLVVADLIATQKITILATIPDTHPRTIINDAGIVPGGKAIVFGTKDTQFKEPIANLYLYTVDDNRISLLADNQTCSNGKTFRSDPRGLILFDIDTPTRKVVRYRLDVAARTVTPDGVAIDLADQTGFPDGMCSCGDDSVIIAFYNPEFATAGKAIRFDLTTGKAIEEWTTPGSPRVTCPCLMKEPDGVKLILTTATEGMPAEMRMKCPNAGSLFIADTQLDSCPEPELVRMG